jgi:hypothetical protein
MSSPLERRPPEHGLDVIRDADTYLDQRKPEFAEAERAGLVVAERVLFAGKMGIRVRVSPAAVEVVAALRAEVLQVR